MARSTPQLNIFAGCSQAGSQWNWTLILPRTKQNIGAHYYYEDTILFAPPSADKSPQPMSILCLVLNKCYLLRGKVVQLVDKAFNFGFEAGDVGAVGVGEDLS